MNHKSSQLSTTKVLRVVTYHNPTLLARSKVLRVGVDVPRGTFLKNILTTLWESVVLGHVLLGPSQSKYPIDST